jgi:hypothetical protein
MGWNFSATQENLFAVIQQENFSFIVSSAKIFKVCRRKWWKLRQENFSILHRSLLTSSDRWKSFSVSFTYEHILIFLSWKIDVDLKTLSISFLARAYVWHAVMRWWVSNGIFAQSFSTTAISPPSLYTFKFYLCLLLKTYLRSRDRL